jgi:carbohydrate-binding DOMON domain-containing protein
MIYLRTLHHIKNSNRIKFAYHKKYTQSGIMNTHTHTHTHLHAHSHTHTYTHTYTHTPTHTHTHTHTNSHKFYKNNRSTLHFLNKKFPQAEYQKQEIQAF